MDWDKMEIEEYNHHGRDVKVRSDLKGKPVWECPEYKSKLFKE